MKNIVITGRVIKRELVLFVICFVLVCIWNAYSIAHYGTSWRELYSVWYAVLFVTVVVYFVAVPFRLLFYWLWRLARRDLRAKS